MADPFTFGIAVFCSALEASTAIAEWRENRQERHRQRALRAQIHEGPPPYTTVTSQTIEPNETAPDVLIDELFLVLSTLGQRILALGVINQSVLPAARDAVRRALSTVLANLRDSFDELDGSMQYTITCAVAFCAECHPMHIYRGFGCGVLNDMTWGYVEVPSRNSQLLEIMDSALALYKSQCYPWNLLTKIPVGVDQKTPSYEEIDGEQQKFVDGLLDDFTSVWEDKGFPQPLDQSLPRISYWRCPFARWGGALLYTDTFHRLRSDIQQDPGRYLFAWIVGNGLNLVPGEALVLCSESTGHLARWLEGLRGIRIKVLWDRDLDWSNIIYSEGTRKFFKGTTGNELGLDDRYPSYIICEPSRNGTTTAPEKVDRRVAPLPLPLPLPPPPPRQPRQVKARFSFVPESGDKLGFKAGDVLEIIYDQVGNGWWVARLRGKVGAVPAWYLQDL
jgi:Variant SH3 domain